MIMNFDAAIEYIIKEKGIDILSDKQFVALLKDLSPNDKMSSLVSSFVNGGIGICFVEMYKDNNTTWDMVTTYCKRRFKEEAFISDEYIDILFKCFGQALNNTDNTNIYNKVITYDVEVELDKAVRDKVHVESDIKKPLIFVHNGNDKWLIDIESRIVIDNKYDEMILFKEGFSRVKRNGKYGFVNENLEEIIPCKYDFAYSFSEGMAAVQKGQKWGYIDKNGVEVIPCIYSSANSFSEGLAGVKKEKAGFVNYAGEIIVPFEYTSTGDLRRGCGCFLG